MKTTVKYFSFFLFSFLLSSVNGYGETYFYEDKNGVLVLSDKKPSENVIKERIKTEISEESNNDEPPEYLKDELSSFIAKDYTEKLSDRFEQNNLDKWKFINKGNGILNLYYNVSKRERNLLIATHDVDLNRKTFSAPIMYQEIPQEVKSFSIEVSFDYEEKSRGKSGIILFDDKKRFLTFSHKNNTFFQFTYYPGEKEDRIKEKKKSAGTKIKLKLFYTGNTFYFYGNSGKGWELIHSFSEEKPFKKFGFFATIWDKKTQTTSLHAIIFTEGD